MKPIFLTTRNDRKLMIIPDTSAHLDGHPAITYSYGIYSDEDDNTDDRLDAIESELHLEKKHDPTYIGEIIFETPEKTFNYIPGDEETLEFFEVQEVIAELNHFRDDSTQWSP